MAYRFGKYSFNLESDYMAARRDGRRIADLTRKGSDSIEIARNYKKQIKDAGIVFESAVGRDFEADLDRTLSAENAKSGNTSRQNALKAIASKSSPVYMTVEKDMTQGEQSPDPALSYFDEEEIQEELLERRRRRRRVSNGLNALKVGTVIAFTICFIVVAYALVIQMQNDFKSRDELNELAQIAASQTVETKDVVTAADTAIDDTQDESADTQETQTRAIMPQYQVLYERNSDLAGWLQIPDTIIDYPVMYLEGDNDFYLSHNFNKEYDVNGLLVLDKRCEPDATGMNILIHGHNMDNGEIFGDLDLYNDYEYYAAHPQIYFNSLYEKRVYDIMAVFVSSVYDSNAGDFAYYDYIQIDTEEDYDTYVQTAKEQSLYDTGITAEYGDELITLSTCEYTHVNGRLVIVGRRRNQ